MKSLPYGLLCLACALGCSADFPGPNLPPVALAGPDRVARINQTVVLDGSKSFDPDGDSIQFKWELVSAQPPQYNLIEVTGFREPTPQVTLRARGVWLLRLTVDDGKLQSLPDLVQLSVESLPCQQDSDCDDHDLCNGSESCVDGECQAGTDLDCDDQDECTEDDCRPSSGCVHTDHSADCDDGNACTEDRCEPADGTCQNTPITGACDDLDPCTIDDVCDQNGVCAGVDRIDLPVEQGGCDLGDPCTDPSCDPGDGSCGYAYNSDPCDDGDPCTKQDTCSQGTCQGSPYVCNDGNLCNGIETCSPDDDGCLPGQNLPDTAFCQGDDLVICDGNGNPISTTSCPLGCNPETDPNHCRSEITETFGENSGDTYQEVTEDASVDGRSPSSNFDTGGDGDGHYVNHDRFLWIRFDVSGLPDGAELQAATLRLYSRWRWNDDWAEDQIYEVTAGAETDPARNWVETQATFQTYDGQQPWTGGEDGGAQDRGSIVSAVTVPQSRNNVWIEWEFNPEGIAYVQGRLDGWVNLTLYGTIVTYSRQFLPAETAWYDDGLRPILEVSYLW